MKKIITVITALLMTASVWAQSPQSMSYQAVIRDASNAILTNQTVGVKISILQGSGIGTAIYVETQTPSTNTNGLISLAIGIGTIVNGDFSAIDWANGPFFIQTETDPTGGTDYTITGTSQLLSVPYALHAKTAGNIIWNLNGNDTYYNDGNVGIGTSIPTTSGIHVKKLNATIRLEDTDSQAGDVYQITNNTLGNDVLNFAVYNKTDERAELSFNGTGNVSLLNGNLGIGNQTPNAKLQVSQGDIYIEDINTGVIMKSPNGQCWRMTVDNSGNPVFSSITCP